MSYTLARPMFRLGGPSADGVGITSGFNRRNYKEGTYEKQLEEEMAKATAKPKFGWDELIAEGYRTVGGASDWKDWIKQGSDRALEIQEERKGLPAKNVEMLINAQASEADWEKKTRPLEVERLRDYFDAGMRLVDQYETWESFSKSTDFAEWEFQMKRAYGRDFPSSFTVYQEIQRAIEVENKARDKRAGLGPLKDDDLIAFKKEKAKAIYSRYVPGLSFDPTVTPTLPGQGNAYGGKPRVARQFGNPNPSGQPELEIGAQIKTPTEDISMQEDISMGQEAPAGDDPYVMLRARLPQEIPDDVVRLIAYNPEAFADFAAIETQEDVMAFNQKYSVELIVNTDEA